MPERARVSPSQQPRSHPATTLEQPIALLDFWCTRCTYVRSALSRFLEALYQDVVSGKIPLFYTRCLFMPRAMTFLFRCSLFELLFYFKCERINSFKFKLSCHVLNLKYFLSFLFCKYLPSKIHFSALFKVFIVLSI